MKKFSTKPPVVEKPLRSPQEVFASVQRNYGFVLEMTVRLMEQVAKVDRLEVYKKWGFESTAAWMTAHFRCDYRRACEFVEAALELEHAKFEEGHA